MRLIFADAWLHGIRRYGGNQAQAQAQFLSNIVDLGMNLQAALDAPRFTKCAFTGCDLQMDEHFPADMRTVLTQRGRKIYPGSDFGLRRGRLIYVRV
jgi:gamma-glutamyltranspeptidase / glutathione hydrolase